MVACRRRRIQDRQRLETSTLATHPQRPSRRSHTPVCSLATSINSMSTGVTTQHPQTVRAWTPGKHPATLDCCTTKRKQPLSSLAVGTSAPRPGLHEFWPGRPTAGQTCPRKVPVVTTSALLHNATKIQSSCPQRSGEALELSQGRLVCFCLLTGESIERLPPPGAPDIERAYQDFCESVFSAAKQCIQRGRRKNYVPCWDKECETFYRSFIRAPAEIASDRAASFLLSRLQQKQE